MYDDDDVLKDGAKKLVANGVKISEVFSSNKIICGTTPFGVSTFLTFKKYLFSFDFGNGDGN